MQSVAGGQDDVRLKLQELLYSGEWVQGLPCLMGSSFGSATGGTPSIGRNAPWGPQSCFPTVRIALFASVREQPASRAI